MTTVIAAHPACLDHLVVLASDLPTGVAWCERTLGITPTAGGEHPLMGTHNRILNISSAAHPRAYLEIIAINSIAASTIEPGARRWFDMDDAGLQSQVAAHGPQPIHWVASVPDIGPARADLAAMGIDRGPILTASRPTPHGLLQWQITVRDDGQRLLDGCLPTLIQWGAVHPCDSLAASGVQLQQLRLEHPQASTLQAACNALDLAHAATICVGNVPRITVQLGTPRGPVTLSSIATG
ncbi:VOC family protein [Acidovorax sp. BL-A-41-H1]|uniref:VOC family protein n=1 Tax=Acidovorax sp. BL-A-41-H1 TaxID=3421102 RepID=UPI003F78E675